MAKVRTIEQLQLLLNEELAWRKSELAIILSLVNARSSSAEIVNCHIRSGITLIYAHWEGFIKAAATAYLTYIASQRLTYSELAHNFVAIALKRLLNDARESNKMTIYAQVVELFTSGLTDRCNLPTEIETKSNLSLEVLKEIISTLGLDYKAYKEEATFIDKTLLASRNSLAHGDYLLVGTEEFIKLHRTIINLMNLFSNQISNAASTKAYQRTSNNNLDQSFIDSH